VVVFTVDVVLVVVEGLGFDEMVFWARGFEVDDVARTVFLG
jgi:hypothetical protein